MNRPRSATTPSSATTATPADRLWLTFSLSAVAIFAATALAITGELWAIFLYELLANGLLAALWLGSAIGIGSALLWGVGISLSNRALSLASSAAMGLGIMSLLTLGLGLAGWLSLSIAVVILTAGLALLVMQLALGWRSIKSSFPTVQRITWLWLLVAPMIALVAVGAFILPGVLWNDEPNGYDVLEYHLQVPREWYEMGRIAPLDHNVFSHLPFNVEMHFLLAMHIGGGPWNGMYLAQLMHFAFIALTVVAVYGTIRVGAKPPAAVAGAMVVALSPWMGMLAPIAYSEGGFLLFGTLAVGWAIHALDSPRRMRAMVLSGAFAGFACGSKLTAVPMVLGAVVVAFLVVGLFRRSGASRSGTSPHPNLFSGREGVRAAGVFVIAAIITFSPWLIRNMVWTGNPVFPQAMNLLGSGHFSEQQVERWNTAHAAAPGERDFVGRIKATWTQLISDWRYGFVVLPLAIVAIAMTWRRPAARFLAILLLIQFIIWIGFTHLQGRFFVMAIPIAAILLGLIERPPWTIAVIVAAVLGVLAGHGQERYEPVARELAKRIDRVLPVIGRISYRDFFEQLILNPEQTMRVFDQDRPVVLVGDAQAFRYQIPMSRLHYRTVFDVDVKPGESIIDAWKGGVPPGAIIVVDPGELRRFARTYTSIPQPQADEQLPYLIDPAAVPIKVD